MPIFTYTEFNRFLARSTAALTCEGAVPPTWSRAATEPSGCNTANTSSPNFGENPRSNVTRAQRFAGGEIDVRIDVHAGRIAGLRLFGDFMGRHDVDTLETMLKSVLYERAAILDALGDLDLSEFFTGISRDEVLGVLLP